MENPARLESPIEYIGLRVWLDGAINVIFDPIKIKWWKKPYVPVTDIYNITFCDVNIREYSDCERIELLGLNKAQVSTLLEIMEKLDVLYDDLGETPDSHYVKDKRWRELESLARRYMAESDYTLQQLVDTNRRSIEAEERNESK